MALLLLLALPAGAARRLILDHFLVLSPSFLLLLLFFPLFLLLVLFFVAVAARPPAPRTLRSLLIPPPAAPYATQRTARFSPSFARRADLAASAVGRGWVAALLQCLGRVPSSSSPWVGATRRGAELLGPLRSDAHPPQVIRAAVPRRGPGVSPAAGCQHRPHHGNKDAVRGDPAAKKRGAAAFKTGTSNTHHRGRGGMTLLFFNWWLVTATPRLVVAADDEFQKIMVTLNPPSPCVDVEGFKDFAGYGCDDWAIYDCFDKVAWGYNDDQMADLVKGCSASCHSCPESVVFHVELTDLSDDRIVDVKLSLTDAETQPFVPDSRSIADGPTSGLTQAVYVPYPGCFEAKIVISDVKYIGRASFTIEAESHDDASDDASVRASTLASSTGSFAPINFCVSDCPPSTPFNVESGGCARCAPGTWLDVQHSICEMCPLKSFQPAPGSRSCLPCPENLSFTSGLGRVDEGACFALATPLYMSNEANRICALSHDDDIYVSVVNEDENLSLPKALVFITDTLFLEANYMNGVVNLYHVDGEFLGTPFAFTGLTTLLYDAPRKLLVVGGDAGSGISVFDVDAAIKLTDTAGAIVVNSLDSTTEPIFTTEAEDRCAGIDRSTCCQLRLAFTTSEKNEVIFIDESGAIQRWCVSPDCDHLGREKTLLKGIDGPPEVTKSRFAAGGLASIPSRGVYLLIESLSNNVYRCPLESEGSDEELVDVCTVLIYIIEASSISVDEERSLIYVAAGRTIKIFLYDGSYLGRLGEHSGSLIKPNSMAFRPGVFTSISALRFTEANNPSTHFVAGETIAFPVVLRDAYNRELTSETAISEVGRFYISARNNNVLQSDGTVTQITHGGTIRMASDSPSLLMSEISLKTAGNWTVEVKEGGRIPTSFAGSPFEIVVRPAVTSPTHCKAIFNRVLVEGDPIEVSVLSHDEYLNPTRNESDVFVAWFEGGEEDTVPFTFVPEMASSSSLSRSGGVYLSAKVLKKPGSYLMHVAMFSVTGASSSRREEVDNSPFGITVYAAASLNDQQSSILDTTTLLIVFGASGVTLLCAIWVVNILRRYMRKKFVTASIDSTRALVQSILLCAFDVAVDIFQFQSNLMACVAQKLWVKLAFGSGFLASVVEIGIGLYYLFHSISIGRVYIHDDMSATYDALCEKQAQEEEEAEMNIMSGASVYSRLVKETTRRVKATSIRLVKESARRATKIAPTLSPLFAPKTITSSVSVLKKSYAFGSDAELVELVKQRMKFEDEMAMARRNVYMSLGGCLTAVFEDVPQIIVNSYRVVTGCGKVDAMTCESKLSDDNYTWTTADSWMFFYSLKTVFFLSMKLRHFHSVKVKRSRMHELKKLIKEKTEECKANRAMHVALADVAPAAFPGARHEAIVLKCATKEDNKNNMLSAYLEQASDLDGFLGQHNPATTSSFATSPEFGAEDMSVLQALNKKLVVENIDLKKSLAEAEKGREEELDEKTFKRFIEVTMHSVPAPSSDELANRDKALSYCGDETHELWKFEKIEGASKSYSTVEMFASKRNTDSSVWGKAVGEIDEAPEVVLAWLWHLTSLERMAIHEKDNGNLLRVSDLSDKSRSQHFKYEFKLGFGIQHRRGLAKYSWFKLEPGKNSSGFEGYCQVWEPDVSSNDHVDEGFTRNSVEATSKGIFLIEKIGEGRAKLTMVQQVTLGGRIPLWAISWMIPNFLSTIVTVQEKFKKDVYGQQASSKAVRKGRRRSSIGF